MENLKLAHKNARKGKGWYQEVKYVDEHLDECLLQIQQILKNQTFKTSEYCSFTKEENGKIRTIYKLPYFPDRIVQWAIIQVIEPYMLRTFTYNTYSSIPGKGIHAALHDVKRAVHRKEYKYCLKLDIRHFYQNINHRILKEQYRRIFKDKKLLMLLNGIIDSINTADIEELNKFYGGSEVDYETGIPIGNYLSQYSGNLYLSEFDHYVKEVLGVEKYYRYMDDIIILGRTKEELKFILFKISEYLTYLKLTIKPNWQIFPTAARGVDFVGYRIYRNKVKLRKGVYKKLRRKSSDVIEYFKRKGAITYSQWCSIESYKGWIGYCSRDGLYKKYISPLKCICLLFYFQEIKQKNTNIINNLTQLCNKQWR